MSNARVVSRVLLVTLAVGLAACPPAKREEAEKPAPAAAKGMRFAWKPSDEVDIAYSAEKKGARVEIETLGKVSAVGTDKLRIHFEPVKIGEKDKNLVDAGKTVAFADVWPDLLVDATTGALVSVEGDVPPAAKDVVAHRWETWMALVGDDLEVGGERSGAGEAEVGEGLLVPVKMHETHEFSADLGHRVVLTRTFEGDQMKKLWLTMLAESGAPKRDIDGVVSATREEKLAFVTEPRTLRHQRVVETLTFAVTMKAGKVERVDMHTETNDFTFTWR